MISMGLALLFTFVCSTILLPLENTITSPASKLVGMDLNRILPTLSLLKYQLPVIADTSNTALVLRLNESSVDDANVSPPAVQTSLSFKFPRPINLP